MHAMHACLCVCVHHRRCRTEQALGMGPAGHFPQYCMTQQPCALSQPSPCLPTSSRGRGPRRGSPPTCRPARPAARAAHTHMANTVTRSTRSRTLQASQTAVAHRREKRAGTGGGGGKIRGGCWGVGGSMLNFIRCDKRGMPVLPRKAARTGLGTHVGPNPAGQARQTTLAATAAARSAAHLCQAPPPQTPARPGVHAPTLPPLLYTQTGSRMHTRRSSLPLPPAPPHTCATPTHAPRPPAPP